jgi:ABC-2 type transport system ATP-binding protein
MAAIETHGLTKEYGDVTALSDLDLTIEEGEVFGFLGPNGAGKTTTIDLLLDFIRPTSGSATVLGYDTRAESDEIRERVGILPDGFDLWDRSTGYEHLDFAIDSTGMGEDPDVLLQEVGLEASAAERPVGEYSKGMKQRLGMALALIGDPDLLILDEPSTGLDPHGIQRMQEIVRDVTDQGTTVFFSSHILSQVSAVCDRVGILDDGQLVTVDTIEGLRETAGVGDSIILTMEGSPEAELTAMDGVTDVSDTGEEVRVTVTDDSAKAQVVHAVVESDTVVHDLTTEEATLGELFEAYTETSADSVEASERGGTEASKTSTTAVTGGS